MAFALTACGTGGTDRNVPVTVPVSSDGPVSAKDRAWLRVASESGLADVRYGELARRKGATEALRRAGGRLVADEEAFGARAARVADGLGIELPVTARSVQLSAARRLEQEAGSRFDSDFVALMTQERLNAITGAEHEIRDGTSPQVTALARTALPDLREHLDLLRKANPIG